MIHLKISFEIEFHGHDLPRETLSAILNDELCQVDSSSQVTILSECEDPQKLPLCLTPGNGCFSRELAMEVPDRLAFLSKVKLVMTHFFHNRIQRFEILKGLVSEDLMDEDRLQDMSLVQFSFDLKALSVLI
jgi:hypothetical protein